jgi:hypothetical protein
MTRDSTGVLIPTGVAQSRSRSQSSQTTIHRRSARWTILGWWTFRICSTPTPSALPRVEPSHDLRAFPEPAEGPGRTRRFRELATLDLQSWSAVGPV